MTLETATTYTVDRNGRLHRPRRPGCGAGAFASREEVAAWWQAGVDAFEARVAASARRRARAFFAPEVRPVRPAAGPRKSVNYFGFAEPTFS